MARCDETPRSLGKFLHTLFAQQSGRQHDEGSGRVSDRINPGHLPWSEAIKSDSDAANQGRAPLGHHPPGREDRAIIGILEQRHAGLATQRETEPRHDHGTGDTCPGPLVGEEVPQSGEGGNDLSAGHPGGHQSCQQHDLQCDHVHDLRFQGRNQIADLAHDREGVEHGSTGSAKRKLVQDYPLLRDSLALDWVFDPACNVDLVPRGHGRASESQPMRQEEPAHVHHEQHAARIGFAGAFHAGAQTCEKAAFIEPATPRATPGTSTPTIFRDAATGDR